MVGSGWRFIFDDAVLTLDSMRRTGDSSRCKAIWEPGARQSHLHGMIQHLPFYQDVLFHHVLAQ